MIDQERIIADMINTNKAVGLFIEVFDLQIVENEKVIPDSEFYFATHGRKLTKDTCTGCAVPRFMLCAMN